MKDELVVIIFDRDYMETENSTIKFDEFFQAMSLPTFRLRYGDMTLVMNKMTKLSDSTYCKLVKIV